MAEAGDLKSPKCQFESDRGHQLNKHMQFKPYSVYVGYDNRVTEYHSGKKGKFPTTEVIEWLHENVGLDCWQFDWDPPIDALIKNTDLMIEIETVQNNTTGTGATFYFDNDDDRLLFCLKWLANNKVDDTLFWHPV